MFGIKLTHLLRGNFVRVFGSGKLEISPTARLKNVRIYVYGNSELKIGDRCHLENCIISVENGQFHIGHYAMVGGNKISATSIIINQGYTKISHHSKISCRRVWVRFGGHFEVGEYTNINNGSEIRCDEYVDIGAYNQISYNVRIWDTNTHCMLPPEKRREITQEKWPYFGFEEDKPITKPIRIGDDCWIGENAGIFKGSMIGDHAIIGYGTLITGKTIPSGARVVNDVKLKIIE